MRVQRKRREIVSGEQGNERDAATKVLNSPVCYRREIHVERLILKGLERDKNALRMSCMLRATSCISMVRVFVLGSLLCMHSRAHQKIKKFVLKICSTPGNNNKFLFSVNEIIPGDSLQIVNLFRPVKLNAGYNTRWTMI